MIIFKTGSDLQKWIHRKKEEGKCIGFVPTMGALHDGHISLIEESKQNADITVCSIFVNPAQFNDPKDFEKYPITIENDLRLLEDSGTDILFLPSVKEIYPDGYKNLPHYELGNLEKVLEGYYRPGHFQGVCAVMHKLLSLVNTDKLFMGQKDYQQCMVIKKMITLTGIKAEFVACPTQREPNGLARSSRNMRLSPSAIEKAAAIFNALTFIKNNINHLSSESCIHKAKEMILSAGFDKIDYTDICNAETLEPVVYKDEPSVALVAAFIEGVRLIDNMLLD